MKVTVRKSGMAKFWIKAKKDNSFKSARRSPTEKANVQDEKG